MPHFPITETVEEALEQAGRSCPDDLGYRYHTFRIQLTEVKRDVLGCPYHTFHIQLTEATTEWQAVLSKLVDAGWQLQGTPVVMEATDAAPRHILITMLHADPHPMQIRGELRLEDIHGHARFEGGVVR